MSAFHLRVDHDRIATLVFDIPDRSANVFTRPALEELDRLLGELASRDDLDCLVLLSGKPSIFIAGADIDEIAHVTDPAEAESGARVGQGLFARWEALPFPTVAAIRGTCVGGGTELALASTYMVASDRADIRIGLPETRLGILPGWGGCVRLPRRIGVIASLDLILAGKTVPSRKAFKLGLLDALFPDATFLREVRAFALARRGRKATPQRHGKPLLEGNPIGRGVVFGQARKKTLVTTKGQYPAPLRALEVIRTGVEKGAAQGFEAEARAIGELAVSPISKSLVHVFRLMEENKRYRPAGADQVTPVRRVGVIGAGVMGGGIAQLAANEANLPVRMKDIGLAPLASGMEHAAGLFAKLRERRRLTAPEAKEKMALIRCALDYSGLRQADLVVEAVVERIEIKQKVFQELAAATRPDTVLASNTSSLSIDLIAGDTPHPERIVGMHFFNPVHRMPLVEVIAGARTGELAVAAVVALSRRLGKTPIVVKDGPGFLVNRLLMFYSAEGLWLLDEGHKIEDLDAALAEWGMPMGPCALTDEVGIDVAVKVAHILAEAFSDRLPFPEWLDRFSADPARLGTKTGSGFYRYEGRKRTEPDPRVYEILGLRPRISSPDPGYLADRMVLPMVNEAARCLDEGVVGSPGELDLAMIMGTGFPPFRGGLCRWADTRGLADVLGELERLAKTCGERYAPSQPLRRIAAAGGFYAAAG